MMILDSGLLFGGHPVSLSSFLCRSIF